MRDSTAGPGFPPLGTSPREGRPGPVGAMPPTPRAVSSAWPRAASRPGRLRPVPVRWPGGGLHRGPFLVGRVVPPVGPGPGPGRGRLAPPRPGFCCPGGFRRAAFSGWFFWVCPWGPASAVCGLPLVALACLRPSPAGSGRPSTSPGGPGPSAVGGPKGRRLNRARFARRPSNPVGASPPRLAAGLEGQPGGL